MVFKLRVRYPHFYSDVFDGLDYVIKIVIYIMQDNIRQSKQKNKKQ